MKITNHDDVNNEVKDESASILSLTEVFLELQKSNRIIHVYKIDNEVFMFRPLGRSEFRSIINNPEFNDLEKEEIICQTCTLWPVLYDFENGDAGTPSTLAKAILTYSHLDSIESRMLVTKKFREEMFELDNQVTCIINEAFPQFDIEEIEKWGIEQTAKYLSRAEWKLQNLRGLNMAYDPYVNAPENEVQQPKPKSKTEEVGENTTFKGASKEKLTPEKLAELKAKFPEVYGKGNIVTDISQMKDSVDSTPPALRPGW